MGMLESSKQRDGPQSGSITAQSTHLRQGIMEDRPKVRKQPDVQLSRILRLSYVRDTDLQGME